MKKLTVLGRKFALTVFCVILLTGGFIAGGFKPGLQATFSEFAMGLSGLLGLYCGGNVTNKLVTNKRDLTSDINNT